MAIGDRAKRVLDTGASIAVLLAGIVLITTLVRDRWLPATPPSPQDVQNLRIEKDKVRVAQGKALVALIEFTDFECPYCALHARNTAAALDKTFVETGIVRRVVFNFPLDRIHPRARRAGEAAECAARQGHYWEMYRMLFSSPEALEPSALNQAAVTLGLNLSSYAECLSGQAADTIEADVQLGRSLGVNSTPTFFVGVIEPDSSIRLEKRLTGAVPLEQFREVISDVSARRTAAPSPQTAARGAP